MGLDTVELVIEVEQAFGISILDTEGERIITVGDLYDFVVAKLPAQETERCLTAAAFYRFRTALTAQVGVDRRQVRPQAHMNTILPEPARRSDWQRLSQHLDWRLTALVRPRWMGSVLLGIMLIAIAANFAACGWASGFHASFLPVAFASSFCGSILLFVGAYHLTTPFATRFDEETLTVGEMVRASLELNFGKLVVSGPGWNGQEVWDILVAIIVTQFGVAPAQVVRSADFVRDFGAD